jgi:nucleoside-diphosphate-sugar epimerase
MVANSFWDRQRILITGGASFIGSHLAEALLANGAQITIVDDLSSGEVRNIEDIQRSIRFIKGDLRESKVADECCRGMDTIFHLASIHGGRGFIETHPAEISQNFLIDGNVFRGAHLSRVRRVCYASSACAYPTTLQTADLARQVRFLSEEMADPFVEGRALADGEYGWTKFMGEMALRAYNKQFGLHGVSCRLFTVYGPRENETHAIVALIAKALLRQDPFEIWGSGQQDRNFTYVDDIVEGMMLAAEKINNCGAINIGTDEIMKIVDAAKVICDFVGHRPSTFFCDLTKPEGVHARAASVQLQQEVLGWRPKVTFNQGVERTIKWFKRDRDVKNLESSLSTRLFERVVS